MCHGGSTRATSTPLPCSQCVRIPPASCKRWLSRDAPSARNDNNCPLIIDDVLLRPVFFPTLKPPSLQMRGHWGARRFHPVTNLGLSENRSATFCKRKIKYVFMNPGGKGRSRYWGPHRLPYGVLLGFGEGFFSPFRTRVMAVVRRKVWWDH